MSYLKLSLFFIAIFSFVGGQCNGDVQNFVYLCRDREKITHQQFLQTKKLLGAQIIYTWRELEPQKDVYDFSKIRTDLNILSKHGKKLFIQLQDSTFSISRKPVPNYLLKDPKYNGGAAYQYNRNDKPDGWVARRWDSNVRYRFHKLMCKLAEKFDGIIEGINLPESAVDIGEGGTPIPYGFSPSAYRDGIIENMRALKKCFSKSVVMQYANFMPGEWLPWEDEGFLKSIYDFGYKNGIGLGTPDLMPKKRSHRNHSYKFMSQSPSSAIIGIAVQDGNYIGRTNDLTIPERPWPNIVPNLYNFASTKLRAKYIFWVIQEPFFSENVVPFLKNL